jgi:hypothetical protein
MNGKMTSFFENEGRPDILIEREDDPKVSNSDITADMTNIYQVQVQRVTAQFAGYYNLCKGWLHSLLATIICVKAGCIVSWLL